MVVPYLNECRTCCGPMATLVAIVMNIVEVTFGFVRIEKKIQSVYIS